MFSFRRRPGGRPSRRAGAVLLALFALPFAAGGVITGGLAVRQVMDAHTMRSWVAVPATIVSADLAEHRGDDSTTYRVVARYRYRAHGRAYESERVGLTGGSDNVGSWHQDRYRELHPYVGVDGGFTCWVDPDDPSRAVLFRDIRWGHLAFLATFSLVFGGVGFGLWAGLLYARRDMDDSDRARAEHPEEPWTWRPEWATGRIRSDTGSSAVGASIFAVIWNLISWPVVFVLPEEIRGGNQAAWIGLVFPAVGIGLAIWAARGILRYRRFGCSVFEPASMPAAVGSRLRGTVVAGRALVPDRGVRVTLHCIRRSTSGSGKNRRTSESILWQDVRVVPRSAIQPRPDGVAIPLAFDLPYDIEPTSPEPGTDGILWRLEAEADVRGIDFAARFEIPVFRTDASDPSFRPAPAGLSAGAGRSGPDDSLAEAGIVLEPLAAGGTRFAFRPARHKGAAIGLTAFLAVWVGAAWALARSDAPMLFPVVFGLFAILIAYGVLDLWFRSGRIDVEHGGIAFVNGLFGAGTERRLTQDAIAEFVARRGTQVGNRLLYRIAVRTNDGRELVAATQIHDLALARRVIHEIESRLA